MKYTVVVSDRTGNKNSDRVDFAKTVQNMIDNGWTPLGGVSIDYTPRQVAGAEQLTLAQAMIKLDPADVQSITSGQMDAAEFEHRVARVIHGGAGNA